MIEIKQIIADMTLSKKQFQKEFKDLKYSRGKSQSQKLLEIKQDKNELYNDLKKQHKQPWVDPGYQNSELNKIEILKPKILSPWELFKAQESIRVNYPKNFKGFKVQNNSEEFGVPQLKVYPKAFQQRLISIEKFNQEYVSKPSKYGVTNLDVIKDKIYKNSQKDQFQLINTGQNNLFGFDRYSTYRSERFLRKHKRVTTNY